MTNKMTNRKALQYVLDNFAEAMPDDVTEKVKAMAASLDHKATNPNRKPTEKQKENANLQTVILDYLRESGAHATCTELGKTIAELDGMNNQRISALLKALVTAGTVGKETVKGKSVFFAL